MKLDDDIKIGAIMQMVPGNLKEHLTLNMDSYDGYYQNVRLAVTNYIESRLGLKMKPPPANSRDPHAMDLSSMQKKPTCSNCGKVGHKKESCWAPGGGAHRPGEGKGQTAWYNRPNPFDDGKKGGKGKGGGKKGGKKGGK